MLFASAALVQIDNRNFRGLAAARRRRPIHRAESPACEIRLLNCNGAPQYCAAAVDTLGASGGSRAWADLGIGLHFWKWCVIITSAHRRGLNRAIRESTMGFTSLITELIKNECISPSLLHELCVSFPFYSQLNPLV